MTQPPSIEASAALPLLSSLLRAEGRGCRVGHPEAEVLGWTGVRF